MSQPNFELLTLEKLVSVVPKIAVIGAECPSSEYQTQQGVKIGYGLRDIVESNGGFVFTGGVAGVGIDVARGVVDYCREKNLKDSKFFVSFPENILPSADYFRFILELDEKLRIIPSGRDMLERQEKLAELADTLVVLNGGEGTLNEAEKAYDLGKTLYCLKSSGGAARQIVEASGENNRIRSFDSAEDLLKDINVF